MANNQFVTREEFKAFLDNPNGDGPSFDILRNVPEAQRLFDVGKNVCKIHNSDGVGSGFHLGGGWIITALHVISDEDTMRAEYLNESTFKFPTEEVINTASRSCIYPILPPNSAEAKALAEALAEASASSEALAEALFKAEKRRMDIALIYVPEIDTVNIPGLVDPFQGPPQAGEHAHLVHFGDEHQCFSVNGEIKKMGQTNGFKYSNFKAYSPLGSCGAPLLTFSEDRKKFLVRGIQFRGDEDDHTRGLALWFAKEHWLQPTVHVASTIMSRILQDYDAHPPLQAYICSCYKELQEHLEKYNLQIFVNKSRPPFLTDSLNNINFQLE